MIFKEESHLIVNGPGFIKETELLIRQARNYIFLHTYIFHYDNMTITLVEELKMANARGVKVFIIIDGFGSINFPHKVIDHLKNQGIHIKYFKPLLSFKEIGIRLHQKVLLVDGEQAIVGGINYSEKYNAIGIESPWLDHALYTSSQEILRLLLKKVFPLYRSHFKLKKTFIGNFATPYGPKTNKVKVIENNWTRYRQEVYRDYLHNIRKANFEIILFATYFIPGKKLLRTLKKASKRGVKIKLIFGKKSDHPMSKLASDYFYKWYLKNGFEVYEWVESIVHSKMGIFDQEIVTIGSYNHNFISRYANLELNITINDQAVSKQVVNEFERVLSHSTQIKKEDYKDSLGSRFFSSLIYIITNMFALFSMIFIYKNYKKKRLTKDQA